MQMEKQSMNMSININDCCKQRFNGRITEECYENCRRYRGEIRIFVVSISSMMFSSYIVQSFYDLTSNKLQQK